MHLTERLRLELWYPSCRSQILTMMDRKWLRHRPRVRHPTVLRVRVQELLREAVRLAHHRDLHLMEGQQVHMFRREHNRNRHRELLQL